MTERSMPKHGVIRNSHWPAAAGRLLRHALAVAVMMSAMSAASADAVPPKGPAPAAEPAAGLGVEHRLSVGDVIQMSVRGFPDLRQQAVVELNGEVSLPLAGRVRVADMTLGEAQALIRKLLTDR